MKAIVCFFLGHKAIKVFYKERKKYFKKCKRCGCALSLPVVDFI